MIGTEYLPSSNVPLSFPLYVPEAFLLALMCWWLLL